MQKTDLDVERFQVEKLKVEVYPSREAAGAAAAKASAEALKELAASGKNVAVIFATGASQSDALIALTSILVCRGNRLMAFTWMTTLDCLSIIRLRFGRIWKKNW